MSLLVYGALIVTNAVVRVTDDYSAFSLLVNGDFIVTGDISILKQKWQETFSLLVNGDFIVTGKTGIVTCNACNRISTIISFQSPSKRRFHCNSVLLTPVYLVGRALSVS